MRLIDADVLMETLGMGENCEDCRSKSVLGKNFCANERCIIDACESITDAPTIEPIRLDDDGTLWVTVEDCDKVWRVIVDEHKSKWCKTFYEEPMQWIPCSERLPSESGRYLVAYPLFKRGDNWLNIMYFGKPAMPNIKVKGKCWYISDDEYGDVVYDNIAAWMPLPEPYKEVTE